MSRLCELLNVTWPVIQAPMAGSQGSGLAMAVSRAGGLGSLPAATLGFDSLTAELQLMQSLAGLPYNVNFFCHTPPVADAAREARWNEALTPFYEQAGLPSPTAPASAARVPFNGAALSVLEAFRPPVVSFHFGLPSAESVQRIKDWGGKILATATTVEEAVWLEAAGADAVIAQGWEAGGHRGMFLTDDLTTQMGLFALLPQVVQAVKVPVVAAGGIVDAQGVRAARALGAEGVQVGTAYLWCPESQTAPLHRAALKSDQARHTAVTNVFTGRPARGMVNLAMRALGENGSCICSSAPVFPLTASAWGPLRSAAEAAGSSDFSPLWAGQGAPACAPRGAAELTQLLGEAWGV
jgi:nitronate monooxygenase